MILYLLNRKFQIVEILESYLSAIWTERYDDHGDAQLKFSTKDYQPRHFPKGYYLYNPESVELMVVYSALVDSKSDQGTTILVKGRSLTGLLERRIIWGQTNINSMLEPAVLRLLDENVLKPSNPARKIPNLSYQPAGSSVPNVYLVEAQYQGESLYKTVLDLCRSFDVGFRITSSPDGDFTFKLYGGENRSYSQHALSHVVFSPEYDSLDKTTYLTDTTDYSNVVLVGGEGEGSDKKFKTVERPGTVLTGIDRFETYHSATNKSTNNEKIPPAQYMAFLEQQGREVLQERVEKNVFDGEIDRSMVSGYGSTYNLGDIVQISDGDIINTPARVVEFIRSYDVNAGEQAFPSLRIK